MAEYVPDLKLLVSTMVVDSENKIDITSTDARNKSTVLGHKTIFSGNIRFNLTDDGFNILQHHYYCYILVDFISIQIYRYIIYWK